MLLFSVYQVTRPGNLLEIRIYLELTLELKKRLKFKELMSLRT